MNELEILQTELQRLNEIVYVLEEEKTSSKYIEQYEEKLVKIKNDIELVSQK